MFSASVLATALALTVPVLAQKPAGAPGNATAQCKDGTYSSAKAEQGACSKHGGVKTWWGAAAAAPAAPKSSSTRSTSAPKAEAGAPANATGQCGDGSYTTAKTKSGACSKHGGVATWFADASAAAPAAPAAKRAPAAEKTAPAAPKTSAPAAPAKPSTAAPKVAGGPENATAKCKDGTYSYAKQHSGACSRHGGVAEWYK